MRMRIWKTFYLGNQASRDLKAASKNMATGDHTVHFDSVGSSAVMESDLSLRELRALFRFAGVPWNGIDYVRDTKPSWKQEVEAE